MNAPQDLNLSALTGHVLAWHKRHWLARRIGGLHLDSIGYVALPFVALEAAAHAAGGRAAPAAPETGASPGATLRERAMARAQQGGADAPPAPSPPPAEPGPLRAAFTEDFMPRYSAAQVATWVAQQGVALACEPDGAPVRKLKLHPGTGAGHLHLRWVLTAQVHVGGKRTRLLVGAGTKPAILGHRLLSPVRLTLCVLALGGTAVLLSKPLWAEPPAAAAAPASALVPAMQALPLPSSASSAASVAAPVAESVAVAVAAPASVALMAMPASASASEPSALPVPAKPADVEPALGRVVLPSVGSVIDQRRLAASQPHTQSARPSATTAVFAVATRPLRTRSEAEQLGAAMRALLVNADAPGLHVDVLAAGEDWRVVCLPYSSPLAADKARAALAARGMKVQVVEF